jgi:hypothetical protein
MWLCSLAFCFVKSRVQASLEPLLHVRTYYSYILKAFSDVQDSRPNV